MSTGRPRTVEELDLWAASHDAEIVEKWRNQDRVNAEVDREVDGIFKRLSALELKVVLFSGFAAGAGGSLGAFLSRLI